MINALIERIAKKIDVGFGADEALAEFQSEYAKIEARLEQREKNLRVLAETFVAVQLAEDMAYLNKYGNLPSPEWRSVHAVRDLMLQSA